ncbi:MAG: DNA primase [Spirochaetaceae bacterium]|jgi:DNA primase|nr:DNA primase [Spirochaetaceae bacterium]
MISQASIQEVSERLDAVSVVSDYVRLEKRGSRYVGLCPFHQEKTPSFSVNQEHKLYYCFGCGKGGSIINFVMEMEKTTFPETIELLAKRFGVQLRYEKAQIEKEKDTRLEALNELYRRVAGSFHSILTEKSLGNAALHYLTERGIRRDIIDRFQLGFAPANRFWLYDFLLKKGYSPEFLAVSGLFSKQHPRLSLFSGRIIFPITDRQGQPVAFGGRILGDGEPKYINSGDSERYKKGLLLFGIDKAQPALRATKEAVLVEGYMDLIALHQSGVSNAVAPLGTAFTDEQAKLLRRWVERVYLYFDSDTAGQKATIKAIFTCRKNALASAIINTDKNFKDPAEILQKMGEKYLHEATKSYIFGFNYLMSYAQSLYSFNTAEGKYQSVAFLFPYVDILDSDIARETALDMIAKEFVLDPKAVRFDYRRFNSSSAAGLDTPRRKEDKTCDDKSLLIAVAINQGWYEQFRVLVSIQEVEDPVAKEIFVALEECFKYGETGLDAVLARISSQEVREQVLKRGSSKEFSINTEVFIIDGINKFKQRQLKRRKNEIMRELATTYKKKSSDYRSIDDLIMEKMHIDAELRSLSSQKDT